LYCRFGPAGNPDSFYREGYKSSLDMPKWLRERGLSAYEYQCVRGVKISEATACRLGEQAAENDISLSIHAPYYINLAADDPDLREKTRKHLFDSLLAAGWMGAGLVVFHPGSPKGDRAGAMTRARQLLGEVVRQAAEEGLGGIFLAPETAGKRSLLGSLDEVLDLCGVSAQIMPTLDFAHLHAASNGGFQCEEAFAGVFRKMEDFLGKGRTKRLHIHFSPVQFTAAGEKRHMTTKDAGYGPDFAFLAGLLAGAGMDFTVICESAGLQAEDALYYKALYERAASMSGIGN